MTVVSLTPETAADEHARLLSRVRFHRTEAKRARRALDLLEADCARVGIRLIRQPKTRQGDHDVRRADSDHR